MKYLYVKIGMYKHICEEIDITDIDYVYIYLLISNKHHVICNASFMLQ